MAVLAAATILAFPARGATTIGYMDQSYSGAQYPPTSDKPQSKLWWNDGSWWADMFDTTSKTWHIFRLDRSSETWVDSSTQIDNRTDTLADVLWDGAHLYVASHVVTISSDSSASASKSNSPARLYRFSYTAGSRTYALDPGFPVTITTWSSESMTIDKDTTGTIWATWTQVTKSGTGYTNAVYVNNTVGDDATWGTPFVLPVTGSNPAPDDISAVVAYGGKIGVMWSNQLDGSMYWAVHIDGTAIDLWRGSTALHGTKQADDHINLKALQSDGSGRVFAAVKTSADDGGFPSSAALLDLLVFKPATGAWSTYTFGTVADCHTRPVVMLDSDHGVVHMLATAPTASGCPYSGYPGSIYEKTAPIDNPVFPVGRGTPVIQDGSSPNLNDATSSKQEVSGTTGLVVLTSNSVTKRYWHMDEPLGSSPTLSPTPTPTGSASATPTPTPSPSPSGSLLAGYANTVLADSPVSYWRLGESSGSTAADAVGSNTGTVNGGVTMGVAGAITGDSDTAFGFNGSSSYVSVADQASLNVTGDFSIEVWAKPNVLNGVGGVLVQKGGPSGYSVWQYRLGTTSGNQWRGTVFIGSSAIAVTAPGTPSTTSWTHLVMTRAGTTLTLYVNGSAAATASASGALNTSTGIFAIGRAGGSAADYFNGTIDEVAFYGSALSASQVAAHYQAGITP